MKDDNEVKGLGGWLILVGIGVVIGPFLLTYEVGPLYYSVFSNGGYEYLTTPGTDAYQPLLGPLLIFEATVNSIQILASFYLIYLFFSKNYLFPKLHIGILMFSVFFIPFDAWLVSYIFPEEPMFDPATTEDFFRSLFAAIIWVPYMLISQRVKATFVKR